MKKIFVAFAFQDADRPIASHIDRKSTRLNSSHDQISYAVFCLKKKKKKTELQSRSDLVCRLPIEKITTTDSETGRYQRSNYAVTSAGIRTDTVRSCASSVTLS